MVSWTKVELWESNVPVYVFATFSDNKCQTSNIPRTLVGNISVDHSDVVGASVGTPPTTSSFLNLRLSALLQLHLHSRLNAWHQWIEQSQLQEETRNSQGLGFGAPYISGLVVMFDGWVLIKFSDIPLHWLHTDHDGVSNHQPPGCLLNCLFRRRSKKTSKLRVTGLCVGDSPGPVNSPHKGPVTRKMFPVDDVIMLSRSITCS